MRHRLRVLEEQRLGDEPSPRPAERRESRQADRRREPLHEAGDLPQVGRECAGRVARAGIVDDDDTLGLGQLVEEERIPGVERSAHPVEQHERSARPDRAIADRAAVHIDVLGGHGAADACAGGRVVMPPRWRHERR